MTRKIYHWSLALGSLVIPACATFDSKDQSKPPEGYKRYPGVVVPKDSQSKSLPTIDPRSSVTGFASDPREAENAYPGQEPINNQIPKTTERIERVEHRPEPEPNRRPRGYVYDTPVVEPVPDSDGVVRPKPPIIRDPGPGILNEIPTINSKTEDAPKALRGQNPEPAKIDEKVIPIQFPVYDKNTGPGPKLIEPATDTKPLRAIPTTIQTNDTKIEAPAPIIKPPQRGPSLGPPTTDQSQGERHQSNHRASDLLTSSPIFNASHTPKPGTLPNAFTGDGHTTGMNNPVYDSPIGRALYACQQRRNEEVASILQSYDPQTQQLLTSLLPVVAILADGRFTTMKPTDVDVLLEYLSRVEGAIRPRASLKASNVCLCRDVKSFGIIVPYAPTHEHRPGDVVYFYLELENFSVLPHAKGGYEVALSSAMEIRDRDGRVAWRADPTGSPTVLNTMPNDFCWNGRMTIPKLPPGNYRLSIRLIDKPTAREVQKSLDLRIVSR